jgi:hypothetical protein
MTLFRGATAVRDAVVLYLSNTVPSMVDQARDDWELNEYQLPYPVGYDAYEPYALDRWPLLGVNVVQAGEFIRLDYDSAMSQRYMSKYLVRVFTWVRTPLVSDDTPMEPEYSQSIRLRDDLAAVVRASLVKSGSLGQPGALLFDEASLTEEYSEATAVKGDRFVSGVIHSFDLRVDESVPIQGLGQANTITVEGQTIAETEEELALLEP